MKVPVAIASVSVVSHHNMFQTFYKVYVNVMDSVPAVYVNCDPEPINLAMTLSTEVAEFTLSNEILHNAEGSLVGLFANILQAGCGFGSINEWTKVIKGNKVLNPSVGYKSSSLGQLSIGGPVYAKPWQAYAHVPDSLQFRETSSLLPGVATRVICPCSSCNMKQPQRTPLKTVIMHLNDQMRWTREQIADWLDELHESGEVDLEFKVDQYVD